MIWNLPPALRCHKLYQPIRKCFTWYPIKFVLFQSLAWSQIRIRAVGDVMRLVKLWPVKFLKMIFLRGYQENFGILTLFLVTMKEPCSIKTWPRTSAHPSHLKQGDVMPSEPLVFWYIPFAILGFMSWVSPIITYSTMGTLAQMKPIDTFIKRGWYL